MGFETGDNNNKDVAADTTTVTTTTTTTVETITKSIIDIDLSSDPTELVQQYHEPTLEEQQQQYQQQYQQYQAPDENQYQQDQYQQNQYYEQQNTIISLEKNTISLEKNTTVSLDKKGDRQATAQQSYQELYPQYPQPGQYNQYGQVAPSQQQQPYNQYGQQQNGYSQLQEEISYSTSLYTQTQTQYTQTQPTQDTLPPQLCSIEESMYTTTTRHSGLPVCDPTVGIPGVLASINVEGKFASIEDGKFIPPTGCTFYSNGNIGKGRLKIRIISARDLIIGDTATKSSDPYVKVKSSCLKSIKATRVIDNCLSPVWEETLYLDIDNAARELLVFDVFDHDTLTADDLLGYVGIDLSLLPLGVEVMTNENLSFASHGTLQIALTALDFGQTNIPSNYIPTYCSWRLSLKGIGKKEFKQIKKDTKHHSYSISSTSRGGPYGKNLACHTSYKIINGFVKRRKTKREKFGDGIVTGLKVAGAVGVVALVAISD